MSRVTGRTVIPTTSAELAVLQQLGIKSLRVPRKLNPYQIARRLQRATSPHPDIEFLRSIAVRTHFIPSPVVPPPRAPSQAEEPAHTAEEYKPEEYNVEVAAE